MDCSVTQLGSELHPIGLLGISATAAWEDPARIGGLPICRVAVATLHWLDAFLRDTLPSDRRSAGNTVDLDEHAFFFRSPLMIPVITYSLFRLFFFITSFLMLVVLLHCFIVVANFLHEDTSCHYFPFLLRHVHESSYGWLVAFHT